MLDKICIIGMGYVGMPLALSFVESGHIVTGFDIDRNKVNMINKGKCWLNHVDPDRVQNAVFSNKLVAKCNIDIDMLSCNVFIVCVPTPLSDSRDPDLAYVIGAAETIGLVLSKSKINSLVILESTTFPGTTNGIFKETIEKISGMRLSLAYSPEREDPGNVEYTNKNTPRVVGAKNKHSLDWATKLYSGLGVEVIQVGSIETAEMVKLHENAFRSVNIALVNELKKFCDKMDGVDCRELLDAAATKPFGYYPFKFGIGVGGHCVPVDPYYLTWKARHYGEHLSMIETAWACNKKMPEYVANRVVQESIKHGLGNKILCLGRAYKPNIADDRESPAVEVIESLKNSGFDVDSYDPLFEDEHPEFEDYDSVVYLVSHDAFQENLFYEKILERSEFIFDATGSFSGFDIVQI